MIARIVPFNPTKNFVIRSAARRPHAARYISGAVPLLESASAKGKAPFNAVNLSHVILRGFQWIPWEIYRDLNDVRNLSGG